MQSRADILHDALEAHSRGQYTLSVPVLLSQAEGAYTESFAVIGATRPHKLYQHKEARWLEVLAGVLTLSEMMLYTCLSAFSSTIPEQLAASVHSPAELAAYKKRFPLGFLSRHGVLHGIDKDYGTRANSSKALFVLDVVRELLASFEPRSLS